MNSMARPFSSLWPHQPPPERRLPSTQVLNTYELLEQILSHLPMIDLFAHLRLSKSWRSIILRSTRLQENMFLTYPSQPICPEPFTYNVQVYCCWNKGQTCYRLPSLTFNPATSMIAPYNISDTTSPMALRQPLAKFRVHQHLFARFTIEDIPDLEPEDRPSWRRMFITHPPLRAVDFEFFAKDDDFRKLVVLWNPVGITFGDLIDGRWRMARDYEVTTGKTAVGEIECSFHLLHPQHDPMEEIW
ncbi:unnamed protein product [Zymoseptoria tritici ST99CH_3D7]|uniref:F-box domain-containing protein n=1 Tax=Zymoseptoria tritici (strain ST99CH_3D7) TaxID=1276538 RepID=A0A1X7RX92_ZYMT9|nr:unnamed protein product [Zymoseptoria tritici ST99CH_3D7]